MHTEQLCLFFYIASGIIIEILACDTNQERTNHVDLEIDVRQGVHTPSCIREFHLPVNYIIVKLIWKNESFSEEMFMSTDSSEQNLVKCY